MREGSKDSQEGLRTRVGLMEKILAGHWGRKRGVEGQARAGGEA